VALAFSCTAGCVCSTFTLGTCVPDDRLGIVSINICELQTKPLRVLFCCDAHLDIECEVDGIANVWFFNAFVFRETAIFIDSDDEIASTYATRYTASCGHVSTYFPPLLHV